MFFSIILILHLIYLITIFSIFILQIAIASILYDHGLLLTSEPLDPIDDEESSGEPDNC